MRYIIGIDLGTTQSCVSYVDTRHPQLPLVQLRIPQLTDATRVESLPTLPSFCYLTAAHESEILSAKLPWKMSSETIVGQFALLQGAKVPTRQVQSAKSWLCHTAARRRDKILPLEAAEEGRRLSPVEATSFYLSHLKQAWNHIFAATDADAELEQQAIYLTVPASFDEVARALTVEAAHQAGFRQLTLLEEPQAAFYSWIAQYEKNPQAQLPAGSNVLVVDVGGGTTDFSLIEVGHTKDAQVFNRKAVGEHLLLGGDSMDYAIAHWVESQLRAQGSPELSTTQWHFLRHEARLAKEQLLMGLETYRIQLQGTGSSVVAGSLGVELQRQEIVDLLLNGFFGVCRWSEALQLRKGSALRNHGLPYAEEPSILKQLAYFLMRTQSASPSHILFNGGAMKPQLFQDAVVQALRSWFPHSNPQVLSSISLDLAVSRGAAYYGKAQRGQGIRIGGGTARGYYLGVGIEETEQALTLLPKGTEEGSVYEPDQLFLVQPNSPVEFRLWTSHTRLNDRQGDLIPLNEEELNALPPIHTVLRLGRKQSDQKVPVRLKIHLTPLGTLELSLQAQQSSHCWNLEFQLRSAEGQENANKAPFKRLDETFDVEYLKPARAILRSLYTSETGDPLYKPQKIMETLETSLGKPRREWSPSTLRGLWEELKDVANQRKRTVTLEKRFWNLAGFLLRPGYGVPLDDHRIKELWKLVLMDSRTEQVDEVRIQNWICLRRVAGALNRGQQQQIAAELIPAVLLKKGAKFDANLYGEQLRTLGSFELLDGAVKIKIGEHLLKKLPDLSKAEVWTLGRLGSRSLLHGAVAQVIPKETIALWIDRLLKPSHLSEEQLLLILGQWGRKTGHRELNLPLSARDKILNFFPPSPQLDRLKAHLLQESALTLVEEEQIFGESLPLGISLAPRSSAEE